ncbi:MAG: PAS domain-containing protein [Zoogloeaceae bacterium]|nr:PAS domain-containing protein [Zoogloeaceae bacterium]
MKNEAVRNDSGKPDLQVEAHHVGTVSIGRPQGGMQSTLEDGRFAGDKFAAITEHLQARIAELESFNADLTNLFAGGNVTTICLDRDGRIKWFVPLSDNHCNLTEMDLGHPLSGIHQAYAGVDLAGDAQTVLERNIPVRRELELENGRCYLRLITPYHATGKYAEGLVVTYTDISENKRLAVKAAEAQRSMADMLEKMVQVRTAQLSTLATELATAEERERRKLAQDLHDDLSQVLSIIKLKLTLLDHQERRGNLRDVLKDIHALTDQANHSVRSLAVRLSPPALHALGLVPALDWLAEEVERLYGLTVHFHDDGASKPIREPARTIVFRAVGELLANVAKHAGAQSADVTCCLIREDRLVVAVSDPGCGFECEEILTSQTGASGLGLLGIRERLARIGGEVNIDSMPGEGTTITLSIPLDPALPSGEDA